MKTAQETQQAVSTELAKYAALGINPAKELVNASRPVPITDGGKPITALFG